MRGKIGRFFKKLSSKLRKNWKRSAAAVLLFILLGATFAVYQYYNQPAPDEPIKKENEPDILEVENKSKDYDLEDDKLDLSSSANGEEEKQTQKEEPQRAIKVSNQGDKVLNNLIKPVDGKVISVCEWYKDKTLDAWKYNPGMDISAEIGTSVKAAQQGAIGEIIKDDFEGTTVVIEHSEKFKTKYVNLRSCKYSEGDQVARGEVIGEVGDSGSSEQNKLRFEVIKEGENISPTDYLN